MRSGEWRDSDGLLCTVGAHSVRPQSNDMQMVYTGEHSDSLRAACGGCSLDAHCGGGVRPYGSAGADEFTNGVPRSYLRAPSLVALPQQSESTTGRVGTRVAVRPWAAIANPGRHAPNPKGRTDCLIAKSTCTGYLERYITVCDVIPSGRTVCAQTAQNHTGRGRTMFAPTG